MNKFQYEVPYRTYGCSRREEVEFMKVSLPALPNGVTIVNRRDDISPLARTIRAAVNKPEPNKEPLPHEIFIGEVTKMYTEYLLNKISEGVADE